MVFYLMEIVIPEKRGDSEMRIEIKKSPIGSRRL